MRISSSIHNPLDLTGLSGEVGGPSTNIFFGHPTYDGKVTTNFNAALINTILHLKDNGVGAVVRYAKHDSFIDRARNSLINAFLESPCTHIAMIDVDEGWEPEKIWEMLKCDVDFVAGAVAQKSLDENYAVRVNVDENMRCIEKNGLISCHRIGLALCLIKRQVFERMIEFHKLPKTMHNGHMFTDIHISEIPGHGYDWVGEDFDFCEKAVAAGIELWIYPDIDIVHVGQHEFKNNFHEYLCRQPGGSKHKKKPDILTRTLDKLKERTENE